MILKSLSVGGYKNLRYTTISITHNAIAVISPNNYGKSNLLEALNFATDFMSAGAKARSFMMAWKSGIPLTPGLANEPFRFELEFEEPELGEYRYVRYGFAFCWYRDDGLGQRVIDERLEMRSNESTRYSSYLKRAKNQYRKGKSTNAFRNIVLEDDMLAIDVLSSVDDLEYGSVLQALRQFEYRVCNTLDVQEQFKFKPISLADEDDKGIRFDDEDVPRALYRLKTMHPDQYLLFEDAVYSLFPEFSEISVQAHELTAKQKPFQLVYSNDTQAMAEKELEKIPFHLKEKIYHVLITSDYLNQPVNMASMSTGTKRIFWLLANIFIASCTGVCCIGVEELETSIHPKMLKDLLEIINDTLQSTCVIISSHSPYLVQYLKPEQIYVGASDEPGVAQFFQIQKSKTKKLLAAARSYDLSIGEYLFELMSGGKVSMGTLRMYLEGFGIGK